MQSRTTNSVYNIAYSLIFFSLILISNFYYRKAFIEYLGVEMLGLNTTLSNLISFINLAELGVGASITFFLYKPLSENDFESVSEISSILKKIYSYIGFIVLIIGTIILIFLKNYFKESNISDWIIYITYFALLFNTLFSYFFNYKQIIFLANQKNYINLIVFQGCRFIKIVLQILFIIYSDNGYIYWIILEFLYPLVATFIFNIIFNTKFQNVNFDFNFDRNSEIFKDIVNKTKQLFFHKMAGFILIQASPLILYFFSDLDNVAIYGNYLIIITGLTAILSMIFNSIISSIGNYIISKTVEESYILYKKIQIFEIFIVSSCCIIFYLLVNEFIIFWIGERYLFPQITIFLMTSFIFISSIRINDTFLTALGIFKDVYAPLIELLINFVLSLLLGYFFGLNGILLAINISLIVILFLWKPFFLNREVFKKRMIEYYKPLLINFIVLILFYFLIIKFLIIENTLLNKIFICFILCIVNFIQCLFNKNFRDIINLIKNRI
ncbi:hypothetical protein [Empedobacter sp.]|uniref:hypothetical protein n=1 Tax=Empedobacter sp. TaxID=1927715 RepID=UPI00289AE2C5|nr:hypothetical protein [Empedobacter sp.]